MAGLVSAFCLARPMGPLFSQLIFAVCAYSLSLVRFLRSAVRLRSPSLAFVVGSAALPRDLRRPCYGTGTAGFRDFRDFQGLPVLARSVLSCGC